MVTREGGAARLERKPEHKGYKGKKKLKWEKGAGKREVTHQKCCEVTSQGNKGKMGLGEKEKIV